MAAEIRERFGLPVEMIKSGGGVYEVTMDGKLLFSKKQQGRFPEDHEIYPEIEARIGD